MEHLAHTPFAPIGCAALAAVLLTMLGIKLVSGYRRSFIAGIGVSLRENFVLANPRLLFLRSSLLTLLAGSLGLMLGGPVASILALIAGLAGPWLLARRFATRRRKQFVYQLPDALLALASALRAGCNLMRGLELMAARQPAPLSQEFSIVLAEQRVGRPLAESLRDLRRRVGAPELDLMNTAMNVSRRVGGNLADTLESLARTLQEKAHVEGKIDALTSMGRAQGWVVGLLPIFIGLVLYGQQPERMSLLFTQWYGWIVLAVIATMMATAAWMIRKIVHIDV
jgi:tight adherence protein B